MSDSGEVREREIRERAEKATEGPWEAQGDMVLRHGYVVARAVSHSPHRRSQPELNAEFIAHAREDIPYLLSRLSELEEENRRLREATTRLLEDLSSYYWHAEDPELEAVNVLRRLVGMRDQLPKGGEAQRQVEEAERPENVE